MTQSPESETTPEEVSEDTGVETKETSTPETQEDPNEAYRKLQSQLDKERAEREKLAEEADYWRTQGETYLTAEQKEKALAERERQEALEKANRLEQELSKRESQEVASKLIESKYPHFKGKDFVQNITGTPEEIEANLELLDKEFRSVHEALEKEESSKVGAESVSPQADSVTPAPEISYEELSKLKPESKAKWAAEAFRNFRKEKLGQ